MVFLSFGRKIPLEEGMAIHASILTWRIPMDRRAWRATVRRVAKSRAWLKQLSMQQKDEGAQNESSDGVSEEEFAIITKSGGQGDAFWMSSGYLKLELP